MFCPRCGNKLIPNNVSCAHCNYQLDTDDILEMEEEAERSKEKNRKHKKVVLQKDSFPTKQETNKQTTYKKQVYKPSYLTLFLMYTMFLLPLVGVIGLVLIYKFTLFSLFGIIMGILIELILWYFVKTTKNSK